MPNRAYTACALLAALTLQPATPAFAAGEILLTHAKALAGNVTPGDAPGYPITLSLPGTYQFSGNVHPTANTIGISIGSDDVTIDLNGFRLHGSTTALFGIAGAAKSVTIKNGTITGFKFDGIFGTGKYWIVDNVRSIENGRDGIVVGQYAVIASTVVVDNAGSGMFVGPNAVIKSSIVVENTGYGINVGFSSVIEGNTVSDNGITGIQTVASTVIGNTINENTSYGLAGGGYTGYSGNTLVGNNIAGGGVEAASVMPQHPNVCQGTCP